MSEMNNEIRRLNRIIDVLIFSNGINGRDSEKSLTLRYGTWNIQLKDVQDSESISDIIKRYRKEIDRLDGESS